MNGRASTLFINDAVRNGEPGCDGAPSYVGWYPRLFFQPSVTFSPTIADVHTDTNQSRVLHVATGYVQPMVLTLETCEGPRAYVGLVSGYHERITENMQRLDDRAWAKQLMGETLPPVAWMRELVAPAP